MRAQERLCLYSLGLPDMRRQPLVWHRDPSAFTGMLLPMCGVMKGALPYKTCPFWHRAMTVA